MTPKEISDLYFELEEDSGGIAVADPPTIFQRLAAKAGKTTDEIRSILKDEWTMGGAG